MRTKKNDKLKTQETTWEHCQSHFVASFLEDAQSAIDRAFSRNINRAVKILGEEYRQPLQESITKHLLVLTRALMEAQRKGGLNHE